ncbi:hypothetical protein BKK56_03475 [Rodentibacter genomosp. 2]|uniref:hypothetical protein n=1 Tax=Pasteurellaceae TaxID=712 RepID=UPI0009856FE7|nr:hypothetical protein [Pasteurella sp. 19428wF3_WM03]OOF56365.1 hypothetical protein BKK56_03475 [Rodentibacter genomosp. 2]TFU53156.1 hypothetical protein E4T92_01795 [Pasteurella sp. WM03]
MIYLFCGISRQHYDKTKLTLLRVTAETYAKAYQFFARDYVLISIGQINPKHHSIARSPLAMEVNNA